MTVLPEPAPATIVVDRTLFTLTLYSYGLHRAKGDVLRIGVKQREFPISVGMEGHATPRGEYRVVAKDREPDWAPPKWSGINDDVIPYKDKRNPFLGGFLSLMWKLEIEDGRVTLEEAKHRGIGIHGVKFDPDLSQRGRYSHGCIRVSEHDLLALYDKVPIGTLVVIF